MKNVFIKIKKKKRIFLNKFKFFLNLIYFEFLKKIPRKIFFPISENKINKIIIDSTYFESPLCKLGLKYSSDKSPYNGYNDKNLPFGEISHRHCYTGIYHFLFNEIKNKVLNFCEIGILNNDSIKLFKDYFTNSNFYAFDRNLEKLQKARSEKLQNVYYDYVDVENEKSLYSAFVKSNVKFDIIIDDSSHAFLDQVNIVKIAHKFLSKNSYLIIEDVYCSRTGIRTLISSKPPSEKDYFNYLEPYLKYYSDYFFIESKHVNEFSPLWNNSKLLVLRKF